ncbi:hypothetical protein Psfp_00194 [Pelotomaculum sp. FP]|uniref:hypothetical protein n=1 Tax=Pelotomaculum sp. FP TaxID=261474 RepID=UPI0010656FC0|nr:hypothetical protein [Pelotomaculum sp. FP]TEB17703.1 hypothetical protein Psfp_00194 [Pelotomaculum sp. FP]
MHVFLLTLAMLLLIGVCCLSKRVERYRKSSNEAVRLIIMMKDQEPWVEGFMRKLIRFTRGMPYLKILVVDDGSSDQTREVLARLQRVYPFGLTHERNAMEAERNPAGDHFFDTRGLTGSALLNAPVFCQLKALNAGKSSGLSK